MTRTSRKRTALRLLVPGVFAWLTCAGALAWAQAPSSVPVRGVVRTAAGVPLAGATVSADTRRAVETDAEGRFRLDLAARSYMLRVARAGYVDVTRQVDVRTSPVALEIDRAWRPIESLQIRHTATYSRNRPA